MVGSLVFHTKPKGQFIYVEWAYGAKWWKGKRLLCESMLVQIGRRTLILKMVESKVFLWNQRINIIYPNEEIMLMVPNHEKKCESMFIPIDRRILIAKNGRK